MTQWMKPCRKKRRCPAKSKCRHTDPHGIRPDCMDHYKDGVIGFCPKCVPEKGRGK